MIKIEKDQLDYYLLKEKHIEISLDKMENFNNHLGKWDYHTTPGLKPGQLFLYEKEIKDKVSFPQIGIYLNCYILDMAIGVEFIPYRRTWENNISYDYVYNGKNYQNTYSELESRIEHFICWNDSLLVYGVWDKLPNFQTLRKAYQNTWTFYKTISEKRDINLVNILNGNK